MSITITIFPQKKVEDEQKKHLADPEEPQSELLTAELQKQSFQSVSKALGEKLLYDTIGARHSSMVSTLPPRLYGEVPM